MVQRPLKNKFINHLFFAAHDYLFPPLCVICDAPRQKNETWLCAECINKLHDNNEKRRPCVCCGQNSRRVRCSCVDGAMWSRDIDSVYSIFDFDNTVKELLHQIKYRGKKSLGFYIGNRFAAAVPDRVFSGIDGIVPVPLHKKREKTRGYNQSVMFTKGIASRVPSIAVFSNVLKRVKNTATQTTLNRHKRMANMEGAFAVAPGMEDFVKGKYLLLIDDVVTTGVTTNEAAKALRQAGGCAGVRVLSIARD
jgi:ComF family protein